MATLDSALVQDFLNDHTQWEFSQEHKALERVFQFRSYMEGIHFVEKVAKIAEELNHHPDDSGLGESNCSRKHP